jgi:Lysozyme like domain
MLPSVNIVSDQTLYEAIRGAGAVQKVAISLVAIALRESGGNITAFNGTEATQDRSYGVWQINLDSPQVATLMRVNGISVAALLTLEGNAKAAMLLCQNETTNLDIAWYINRLGVYEDRYNSFLPRAVAASLLSAL